MTATSRGEAEASARHELARVLDVCGSCRRCVDTCEVFPTLFARLDTTADGAGDMTPDEQDSLVGACTSCGRCVAGCPYAPGLDVQAVDVAAALRAVAVTGGVSLRVALAALLGARGARWLRGQRRSWRTRRWRSASLSRVESSDADAVVVLTCGIAGRPGLSTAILDELGHSGRRCSVARPAACCGAPLFAAGRIAAARRVARRVVSRLEPHARRGAALVVAEPGCLRTIAVEYPRVLGTEAASVVAAAAVDPCEAIDADSLDVRVEASLNYLAPCHVHPRRTSPAGVDLLRRAGARVRVVEGCAPGGPAAEVGECEHAAGLRHPLEVVAAARSRADWGPPGLGS
jgi:glycerol-3-phosphate dehydrogenase subunit C